MGFLLVAICKCDLPSLEVCLERMSEDWKSKHLHDPNRKVIADCPHCDWKAYSVMGAWGKASHMWKVHGIPGQMTHNGRTVFYGPDSDQKDPFIKLK